MTRMLFILLAGIALLAGCHRPFHVVTQNTLTSRNEVTTRVPPTDDAGPLLEMPVMPGRSGLQRIALIDVDGLLVNSEQAGPYSLGQNPVAIFRERLDYVARHPHFSAVVLRINSPGGGVTASDIMWRDLIRFKARTGLPVVACLMDVGAGGAYYLATAADVIIAHPTTITGGIGVILNLYNLEDLMLQFNIVGVPIKAGEHIDLGTPIRPATDEQRQILREVAERFHGRFIAVVHERRPGTRGQPYTTFDGRIFTADEARVRRLIDDIGYLDDAIARAVELGGCPGASVVMLHRERDRAQSPYDTSPNTPLQEEWLPIRIPGLDRSRLPTYLYLWQPDPSLSARQGP